MAKKLKYVIAPNAAPSKSAEVKYQRQLLAIINEINRLVKKSILPIIKADSKPISAVEDSSDGVGVFDAEIQEITEQFAIIQTLLNFDEGGNSTRSAEFVGIVGKQAATKADAALKTAGFLLPRNAEIVARQGLNEALDALTAENVALIKRIGSEYLQKIQQAVLDNYLTGKFVGKGGIIKELQRINGISKRRAKLIARDQSNKISGTVTKMRSQATGAIGYQWKDSRDERVRGNPSGKYPNLPSSRDHWKRNKKYFLWEPMKNPPIAPDGKPFRQPPAEGPPGIPISCRCHARSVWIFEE